MAGGGWRVAGGGWRKIAAASIPRPAISCILLVIRNSDSSPELLHLTIVLDGVGIGAADDADLYGDAGADTLGHVLAAEHPHLPNLTRLGLGNAAALTGRTLTGVPPAGAPAARFGQMTEVSAGKDSTTGHWELAGLTLRRPFPTYPDGLPADLLQRFADRVGVPGVLGGEPISGTTVIERYGERHLATGQPIVYTSADSVFQIATHDAVTDLDTLYAWCRIARDEICVGEHAVGRVIARPFTGEPGDFRRRSDKRKDYALAPQEPALQQQLQAAGVRTVAVGKIADLFAGVGFDEARKTTSNAEGVRETLAAVRAAEGPTFVWTNLVDFDQDYGHRNDAPGFARALEAFDRALPEIEAALADHAARHGRARLVLTADHGNDPTYPGTDHTRERVPLLVLDFGAEAAGGDLGVRASFGDHAAACAAFFDVPYEGAGEAF